MNTQEKIIDEVVQRRIRRDYKPGPNYNQHCVRMVILGSHLGRANKAVLEGDFHTYRNELVEIASIALFIFGISEVIQERKRQDKKWGADRKLHPLVWLCILGEEVGEANEAVLKEDGVNYREELIQVAAVAIAAAEGYDNHGIEAKDK
jgi:NTP pyrophosphatase (non-canonical NTP hydrolase)